MSEEISTSVVDGEPRRSGESSIPFLPALLRRRWLVLGPLFVVGLLGYAGSYFVPVLYRSESTIVVEQQKIPTEYVTPNVLTTLQNRLDVLKQQILSRTRLQQFIQDMGLYTSERQKMTMDDVIDVMRKRISVQLVQAPGYQADLTGFRINFSDSDPHNAQRVTNELTSMFIEQNIRERNQQSTGTTAFLEGQLEEARKDLAREEERVRQYKMQYLGQLPEQQQTSLQILSSLQAQLQANTSALDRAQQQRTYHEAMRSQYEAVRGMTKPQDAPTKPGASATAAGSLSSAEATLDGLWQQLDAANRTYTERHPEVKRLKQEIAEWEATVQRLRSDRMSMVEMDSRLKANRVEIEHLTRESDDLRKRIGDIQHRLSLIPMREQELAELTRRYDSTRTHYQSLLQKRLNSEVASNLEQRQGGEQFRLLDPASLPTRPEKGRLKVVGIAWAFGLALGLGFAALREMTDQTVHSKGDLAALGFPVLVPIPSLRTPGEEARQARTLRFEIAAVAAVFLLSLGTGAHTYLRG